MAPSRDLFGVPSSSISALSSPDWSSASVPGDRLRDLAVDVLDRLRDALAAPGVAAVAQLGRLELAGRRAGRHGRAAGAPERSASSTSTVGLPRESRIWRAWTVSICDTRSSWQVLVREARLRVVRELRVGTQIVPSRRPSLRRGPPRAWTRQRKRSAAARSASSGSTLSLRATLTAANSTSPTSWNAASRSGASRSSSSSPSTAS